MLLITRTDKSFLRLIASLSLVFGLVINVPSNALAAKAIDVSPTQADMPVVPNVSFTDLRGAPFKLQDISGKLRVLHYWATWCAPCVEELPHLDKIQADYQRYGLKVITISLDAQGERVVRDFLQNHRITNLEPYLEPSGRDARRLGVNGLPTSIFIDSRGRAVARTNGPIDWQSNEAKQALEQMLGLTR